MDNTSSIHPLHRGIHRTAGVFLAIAFCGMDVAATAHPSRLNRPVRIAFGACARPYEPDSGLEDTLREIMRRNPDFMVWGGHLAHVKARMRDVLERERR